MGVRIVCREELPYHTGALCVCPGVAGTLLKTQKREAGAEVWRGDVQLVGDGEERDLKEEGT